MVPQGAWGGGCYGWVMTGAAGWARRLGSGYDQSRCVIHPGARKDWLDRTTSAIENVNAQEEDIEEALSDMREPLPYCGERRDVVGSVVPQAVDNGEVTLEPTMRSLIVELECAGY